jgi:hypothetical protein
MKMNLLPIAFRRRLLIVRTLRFWAAVWGVSVLAASIMCGLLWVELWGWRRELTHHQEDAAELQAMQAENQKLAADISSISRRAAVVEDVHGIAQPLALLGVVSRSAKAADRQLQVQKMQVSHIEEKIVDPKARPGAAVAKDAPVRRRLEVSLSGVALDDVSVAKFVTSLRESGMFDTVELKSSLGVPLPHGEARKYAVLCRR